MIGSGRCAHYLMRNIAIKGSVYRSVLIRPRSLDHEWTFALLPDNKPNLCCCSPRLWERRGGVDHEEYMNTVVQTQPRVWSRSKAGTARRVFIGSHLCVVFLTHASRRHASTKNTDSWALIIKHCHWAGEGGLSLSLTGTLRTLVDNDTHYWTKM